MKIVIAPQTFKGSISALEVAKAMREGTERVIRGADIVLIPVADGGDGTLETLVEASGGKIRTSIVTGPLGQPLTTQWGAMGDGNTAVIEMARTSGLALVPIEMRNPLITTTFGLGEAIQQGLKEGYRKFIIGIGGSATNDAGAGMAQALGIKLLSKDGKDLPFGGAALSLLDRIDVSGLDKLVKESEFMVACDVNNPLTGPEGASVIYGPQKGANSVMIEELDAALEHFSNIVKRDIGVDIGKIPGSGAAGGLGAGLIAFLDGKLRAGVDIVLDTVDFDNRLTGADLVMTGEGSLDHSTVYNKAPVGVARLAKAKGIPVIAISGSLGEGFQEIYNYGIDAVSAITPGPMTLDMASSNAFKLISNATEESLRFMKLGSRIFS